MASHHIPWASTENLSAAFLEDMDLKDKLDALVCVTEKLDGSNLGIHVRRDDSSEVGWGLAALHGRRSILWQPAPDGGLIEHHDATGGSLWHPPTPSADRGRKAGLDFPTAIKYGNAGSLQSLPTECFRFAAAVANEMSAMRANEGNKETFAELIIYGEAIKVGGNKTARPSFHPFGLAILEPENADDESSDEDDNDSSGDVDGGCDCMHGDDADAMATALPHRRWRRHKLTSEIHALFARHEINGPSRTATMATEPLGSLFEHLAATGTAGHRYVVCPPPLVFVGPFKEAVAMVEPLLRCAPREVEGVFLKADTVGPSPAGGDAGMRSKLYYKWKTPVHEEQQRGQTLAEVAVQQHAYAQTGRRMARTALMEQVAGLPEEDMRLLEAKLAPEFVKVFQLVSGLLDLKQSPARQKSSDKVAGNANKAPKVTAKMDPDSNPLHARILEAFRRETTKDAALAPGVMATIEKKNRKPVADRVASAVLSEVEQRMAQDGETADAYSFGCDGIKFLKAQVDAFVRGVIFKDEVEQYRMG